MRKKKTLHEEIFQKSSVEKWRVFYTILAIGGFVVVTIATIATRWLPTHDLSPIFLGVTGGVVAGILLFTLGLFHELAIGVRREKKRKKDKEYPKPVTKQIEALTKLFPNLNSTAALALAKNLPELPEGAKGWFAIPKFEKIASTYNKAIKIILLMIARVEGWDDLCSQRKRISKKLGPNTLTLTEQTEGALTTLSEQQEGDILLIPAHPQSPVQIRKGHTPPQKSFGLGPYELAVILLTHPVLSGNVQNLFTDCAGANYSLKDQCLLHYLFEQLGLLRPYTVIYHADGYPSAFGFFF